MSANVRYGPKADCGLVPPQTRLTSYISCRVPGMLTSSPHVLGFRVHFLQPCTSVHLFRDSFFFQIPHFYDSAVWLFGCFFCIALAFIYFTGLVVHAARRVSLSSEFTRREMIMDALA